MRPKPSDDEPTGDLFRARLEQIINMRHELVQLAQRIDWAWLDEEVAPCFSDEGRPGVSSRYMLGLLLLKHIYALSDEGVCERWVHDPYFQYFTGERFFQHELRHERSGLTHWRKRLGDKLELLLAESLRIAHDTGAVETRHLERISVDTTVQPKNITHPTDAKLMYRAIVMLGRLAREHGVELRQSYIRVGKRAQIMAGRYTHAKQFKRANRELKFLRTRLGRLSRDIRRKTADDPDLQEIFAIPLTRADQVRHQRQQQRGWKLYSLHAPEVECIGKGKAHKPYEFGCKVSIAATNACAPGGRFVLHAKALHGNPGACPRAGRSPDPGDGHTLGEVIEETRALTGIEVRRIYVDKGYRGHNAPKTLRVYRSGQKRGVFGVIKRELKRRAGIEAVIGHLKTDGHLGRNFLKGRHGDQANAVLSAAGYNFRLLLSWLRSLLRLILAAILRRLGSNQTIGTAAPALRSAS